MPTGFQPTVHVGNREHLTTVVGAAAVAGRSMCQLASHPLCAISPPLLGTHSPPGALAATPGRAAELRAHTPRSGG
jgi:hypothetical protein